MRPSFEQAKRLSHRMQQVLAVIGVLIGGTALWLAIKAISDPAWVGVVFKGKYGDLGAQFFSTGQIMGLIALFFMQIGMLLAGLYALWQAFGSIAKSDGITLTMAQWLRRSGFWFGAATLMMIVSNPLNSLIGSIGAGRGNRFVSVGFESQHLMAFLLSAVLLILGHVLALAADIAEDNRQIV